MKKCNPELGALSLVDWRFFLTLTFKGAELSERKRVTMLFAYLRKVASKSGLHFSRLLWVVRTERGESFGRLHFHALIAGFPATWSTQGHCNSLESLWREVGGGHARASLYDPNLDAVRYILKGGDKEAQSLASRKAGDDYEFSKFGSSSELTLGKSLIRHLMNRGRPGLRGHRNGLDEARSQDSV